MSDWTSGYVADINYTYGYYAELNPLRVNLAFLNAGIRPPEVINACELGFGQGLSTNIHAAASKVNWYGTDFNPNQAAFAQEVANASNSGAKLFDNSFEELNQRDDLPEFDFIGLHGIWSWISDENRAIVVDFIRRKLRVGGVLYISYNTQPGWASMVPMRELLVEHSEMMSASGAGVLNRVEDALNFADKLLQVNPSYIKANPQIKGRIEKMRKDNKNYLAHEYFNRDWEPMSFSKMADWLSPAKLEWAASARYADAVESIQLTQEQRSLLDSISNPVFRQTVRDFCENRQFRTDLWIRGGRRLSHLEKQEAFDKLRIVMVVPRTSVELKLAGHLGNFDLPEAIYQPILDILDNHTPITIGEVRKQLEGKGIGSVALLSAINILAAKNVVLPAQGEADIERVQASVNKINKFILNQSRSAIGEISYLASSVVGGGVTVPLVNQLFLLSVLDGGTKPQDMASLAWKALAANNKCLIKDGKSLVGEKDNLTELKRQATEFNQITLPIYKNLGVVVL